MVEGTYAAGFPVQRGIYNAVTEEESMQREEGMEDPEMRIKEPSEVQLFFFPLLQTSDFKLKVMVCRISGERAEVLR